MNFLNLLNCLNKNNNLLLANNSSNSFVDEQVPVFDTTNLTEVSGSNLSTFGTTYFYDIAYGNGIYLLSAGAYIISSTDLINWTARINIGAVSRTIVYGNGLFVIASDDASFIKYTYDGITYYDTNYLSFTGNSKGLRISDNKFLAFNGSYTIGVSSDGIDWTEQDTYLSSSVNSVAYGNGIYVVISVTGECTTSSDLIVWSTPIAITGGTSINLIFKNGLFISPSTSAIRTSSDGINWTSTPTNLALSSFAAGVTGIVPFGDYFFLYHGNSSGDAPVYLAVSKNLTDWYTTGVPNGPVNSSEGYFSLKVANNELYLLKANGTLFKTSLKNKTGAYWRNPLKNTSTDYLYYDNSKYGAYSTATNDKISSDLITWTDDATSYAGIGTIYAKIYANGYYVVAGTSGIYISTTGKGSWTLSKSIGVAASSLFQVVNGLLFYGVYSATGTTNLFYTSDFTSWIECGSNTAGANPGQLIYNGSKYILCTKVGIYSSTNLTSWTQLSTLFTNRNLCYGNGMIIATSRSATSALVYYSTDAGNNWNSYSISTNISTFSLVRPVYFNGVFIAAGINSTILHLCYSYDGINWSTFQSTSGTTARQILLANNKVIVSYNGAAGGIMASS